MVFNPNIQSVARFWYPIVFITLMLLTGVAYVGPLLAIEYNLNKNGQPLVFSYENYRNDLTYLTRAREVYDGYAPSHDPFFGENRPTPRNPAPSVILAGFIHSANGNMVNAYKLALFVFSQINFLLLYFLGLRLFGRRRWALFFAVVGILTPISLRILNFHGTA